MIKEGNFNGMLVYFVIDMSDKSSKHKNDLFSPFSLIWNDETRVAGNPNIDAT